MTLLTSTRAGGAGGVLVVLAVVVVVVLVVRWRLGRAARSARVGGAALDPAGVTADEHRRRAAEHEAAGRHDDAVREWMRALVRGLEERDLLVARPGRTAGEAAREVATMLPGAAGAVAEAARALRRDGLRRPSRRRRTPSPGSGPRTRPRGRPRPVPA